MCPGKRVTRSRRPDVDAEDNDNDDDEDEGDSTGIKWEEETVSGMRPPPPMPVEEDTR